MSWIEVRWLQTNMDLSALKFTTESLFHDTRMLECTGKTMISPSSYFVLGLHGVCVLMAETQTEETWPKAAKRVTYSRHARCTVPELQSFEFQPTVTI